MDLLLRTDLERIVLGNFALPLGIDPTDQRPPVVGYTLAYTTGEDDEPDTYTFHAVVSHENLKPLIHRVFQLLPVHVFPIVEIDSYDAYRLVDVYIGREDEPVLIDDFLEAWQELEPVLLEDGAVGAGANSDDPFVEIFVDQWKGVSIHVPLDMRDTVEALLQAQGLEEVASTWPTSDNDAHFDATIRPVLESEDEKAPTLDDVVLEMRHRWMLELNIDPDRNLDAGGRDLGITLWNAGIEVNSAIGAEEGRSAFMGVWASARSLTELEELIQEKLTEYPEWAFFECYSVTRVPFDDRPESLESLEPRRKEAAIHQVEIHQPVEDEADESG